jgi:hypothetical protein
MRRQRRQDEDDERWHLEELARIGNDHGDDQRRRNGDSSAPTEHRSYDKTGRSDDMSSSDVSTVVPC